MKYSLRSAVFAAAAIGALVATTPAYADAPDEAQVKQDLTFCAFTANLAFPGLSDEDRKFMAIGCAGILSSLQDKGILPPDWKSRMTGQDNQSSQPGSGDTSSGNNNNGDTSGSKGGDSKSDNSSGSDGSSDNGGDTNFHI